MRDSKIEVIGKQKETYIKTRAKEIEVSIKNRNISRQDKKLVVKVKTNFKAR